MGNVHFDEHSVRKYVLTIFLGFAAVFCFLMLMMQWHGDFKPVGAHSEGTATEQHGEAPKAGGHEGH